MLIKCEECKLPVSDKAKTCPHCGISLIKKEATRTSRKRRRLPNGFGQISEIKSKRLRNRFRAMVSVGIDSSGKRIVKLLKPVSYFPTYNDAYQALVEYNRDPYELKDTMTVEEVYNKWSEEYFKKLKSDTSIRTITSAWAYCNTIKHMEISAIRTRHIKGCINDSTAIIKGEIRKSTPGVKSRMKSLFNLMLDYAVEYELTDRNYARMFNLNGECYGNTESTGHIPFQEEEMNILWSNLDRPYVDIILIQCYTGFRPQELGLIKLENVDLVKKTIIAGMKTGAGTDRLVPIHSRIYDIISQKYEEALSLNSEYLLNCVDSTRGKNKYFLSYDKYNHRFQTIVNNLGLSSEHRAHDPRVHFVTMAKKYKVDEYAIKYIVGHAIVDITEKVYTDREDSWLKKEIEKIR